MELLLWNDTETTGIDETKHGIIQQAFVLTDAAFDVKAYFQTLVHPFTGCEITEEALKINGKTREQIAEAPQESKVIDSMKRFSELLLCQGGKKPIFAGFVCDFDLKMNDAMLRRHSDKPFYPYQVPAFDIFKEAKRLLPGLPKRPCERENCYKCQKGDMHTHRLVDVAAHFGIKIQAHDAMGDLKATIAIAKLLFPEGAPIKCEKKSVASQSK